MKYIFTLIALLFFQIAFTQKNVHSIAFMGGIPLKTKNWWYDYFVPLTLEYEFRRGKSGFSVGIQGELAIENYKSNFQSIIEFEAYCKKQIAVQSGFSSSSSCYYSYYRKTIYANLPISYTYYAWSNKKMEVFLKAGIILNFQIQSEFEYEYPKYDNTGKFTDSGPFFEKRTIKKARFDDYQGALSSGVSYKINKKIKLLGFLQYQNAFSDFPPQSSSRSKIFFHLGTSLKI